MYMGVKSYHELPSVSSYEDAQRALAKWESKSRRGKRCDRVNRHEDGSIAFQLYDTEVVTWQPDNSFTVNNYGTKTTSEYADRFVPSGVRLHHPVLIQGCAGGHRGITFRSPTEYAMCQGTYVRFHEVDGHWVPDEDTLDDVTMPNGVDRRSAQKLGKEHHLGDFAIWLDMATRHLELEHDTYNLAECATALQQRDFRTAVSFMPVISIGRAFGHHDRMKPLPITTARGTYISMGCIAKLKQALCGDAGVTQTETRKIWPRRVYETRVRQLRELERLKVAEYGMGFS